MQKWIIKRMANPQRSFTENLILTGAAGAFIILVVKEHYGLDIDNVEFWIWAGSSFVLSFLYLKTLVKTSVFELYDDKLVWTVDNTNLNSKQYSIEYAGITQCYSYRTKGNTILIIIPGRQKKGQVRIAQSNLRIMGNYSVDDTHKFEEFVRSLHEKLAARGIQNLGKPAFIKELKLFSSYGELIAIAIGGLIGMAVVLLTCNYSGTT